MCSVCCSTPVGSDGLLFLGSALKVCTMFLVYVAYFLVKGIHMACLRGLRACTWVCMCVYIYTYILHTYMYTDLFIFLCV